MPTTPEVPGLASGEHVLGTWFAQPVEEGEVSLRRGRLVLTNRRLLFLRRGGLFGGKRFEKQPIFAAALEDLRTATPRRFYLWIGYGDRMEIPGLAIAGHELQLDRETPSKGVLSQVAGARASRLLQLGEPIPGDACSTCGAWGPERATRCVSCGATFSSQSLA